MTPPTDDKLEHLMTRALDGEATEADELELQKAILRSPEVRQRVDEYRRNDALATGAMRAVLGRGRPEVPTSTAPVHVRQLGRWSSMLAMAASVMVGVGLALSVVLIRSPDASGPDVSRTSQQAGQITSDAPPRPSPPLIRAGAAYRPEVPHRRSRQVDHEYLILQDEDEPNRFYLIERNRTRTLVMPGGGDL